MAAPPRQKTALDNSRTLRLCSAATAAYAFVALGVAPIAAAEPTDDATASAPAACGNWRAELSSIQGVVEIRRGNGPWTPAVGNDILCSGDSVRAHEFSRAMVRLRDDSVLRLDERATLTLSEDGAGSLIELIRGVIHVISRDPRSLRFSTPYANAGIKGTEFDIRVTDTQTEVAVLEGEVVVTNPLGRVDAPSGYVAMSRQGEQPETFPLPKPIELMRWASYFAEVLDRELPAPEAEPSRGAGAAFFTERAAARLRRGNLATAEADIGTALRLAPGDPDALALDAVAAVGRNDLARARVSAAASTAASTPTAAAFVALSHVQQADAALAGALASARAAIALEPQNAIAWARLAEIELGLENRTAALEATRRAIALRPDLGYAHTVLGFVRLAGSDLGEALAAFADAAALDAGAPLPHLGSALALIQRGEQTAGRRELEIAVALDPANALTRSYMAKTYDAENRAALPDTQLALAKELDPTDPTPWLYEALVSLQRNRPVDALKNLLGAIELNDNRALFRSRLAMDADLATRSAGTGRVVRELGFEELALVRGWTALTSDPTDYAAHRLLADVYSARPREEISRVSELLTSQLLQPANLRPIEPQLAQGGPLLVQRAAPSELAFSELAPLLTSNGLRLQASTVAGANDTFGESVAVAGLRNRVSYSAGQFRYSTDGFRENNDFDQRIANAFVQVAANEHTMLHAELRSSEVERGDLARRFDTELYSDTFRFHETADTLRLGARRQISARDTLLVSLMEVDSDGTTGIPGELQLDWKAEGWSGDVQLIHEAERWNLRGGLIAAGNDQRESWALAGAWVGGENDASQRSAYAYANVGLTDSLLLTAGASADEVDEGALHRRRLNPKLGLMWSPREEVVVRFAAFDTLLGSLSTSKQNPQPRLEPVQVAGFNQFHLGPNADESTFTGLAVDATFSKQLFGGAEITSRDIDTTLAVPDPATILPLMVLPSKHTEDGVRAYVYWAPRNDVSLSAQYQVERQKADEANAFGFASVRSRRIPLEARYFSASGFSAGLRASHVEQRGEFVITPPAFTGPESRDDDFWILDASFGYRLADRRGVLSFNIDNLLDKSFRYQDLDPENPSLTPERMAYVRFTLAFE